MPVKILLADKSITIQKVVEMLFSGRDYEVSCASDGETALNEAGRIVPDVVLADVDLPRIDGYSFSARLKQIPALAQTPVVLMLSRDDVFDEAKAKQAGIADSIEKPFESQELMGKVRKAVAAAPPRPVEPAAAAPRPAPVAAPAAAARPTPPAPPPKQTTPADIFDIIQEAPTKAELKRAAAAPSPAVEEEAVFEVEPELEMEEPQVREAEQVLPVGDKAVSEMRAGLGLTDKAEQIEPDLAIFESLGMAATAALDTYAKPSKGLPKTASVDLPLPEAREYVPPVQREPEVAAPAFALSEDQLLSMAQTTISKMANDVFTKLPPVQPPTVSPEELRTMAEAATAKLAQELFAQLPPIQPPTVSEEMIRSVMDESIAKVVRETAREVIEKIAWEVIPQLAEVLIKEEIERLKAKT